ncbi:hypothetical protein GDO81_019869 [Engystomops pustulosus]|uniref:Secreted protein n=1 Tax=Engystomops pustulosus TaxID=76066 RepID=A0AAV6YVF9_ENGPU|nr:hypothetical protein GDO81_019869 [Engystomops pustulosus]
MDSLCADGEALCCCWSCIWAICSSCSRSALRCWAASRAASRAACLSSCCIYSCILRLGSQSPICWRIREKEVSIPLAPPCPAGCCKTSPICSSEAGGPWSGSAEGWDCTSNSTSV